MFWLNQVLYKQSPRRSLVGQAHKITRGPVRKNPSRDKPEPVFAATPPCYFVGVPAKQPGGVGFNFIRSLIKPKLQDRTLS